MRNLLIAILVCLLPSFSPALFGQDWEQDISRLHEAYEGLETLHLKAVSEEFEGKPGGKPASSETTEFYMNGDEFFYRFGKKSEMLFSKKVILSISHDRQEIIVSERGDKRRLGLPESPKANISKELDSKFEKREYLGTESGMKHYRLSGGKSQGITQIDLFLDLKTGICRKILYEYGNRKDVYWISIRIEVFDTSPQFPKDTFNEERYISASKGKYRASSQYSGYDLRSIQ